MFEVGLFEAYLMKECHRGNLCNLCGTLATLYWVNKDENIQPNKFSEFV